MGTEHTGLEFGAVDLEPGGWVHRDRRLSKRTKLEKPQFTAFVCINETQQSRQYVSVRDASGWNCMASVNIFRRQGLICEHHCPSQPSSLGLLTFLSQFFIHLETKAHAHLLLSVVDGTGGANGNADA